MNYLFIIFEENIKKFSNQLKNALSQRPVIQTIIMCEFLNYNKNFFENLI